MSKKKTPPRPEELGMPRVGVDTHAHLDYGPFDEDLELTLERGRAAGLAYVGNVFLGPDNYEAHVSLFDAHPDVFFLLGVHPHDSASLNDEVLARLERHFRTQPRIKAMGEIGLDYFYVDESSPEVQLAGFKAQLELARALDLPVNIHSRDADNDTIQTLLDLGFKDRPVIWHCFGKTRALAERILAQGWLISFPGIVTFAKNEYVLEAAAAVPLDKLVLETDCPFLSPTPYRGKRNEPAYSVFTCAAIAARRGRLPEELWRICGENACAFYGLETPAG
jgi:TatD DNase family protein